MGVVYRCIFENYVSTEMLVRLAAFPAMRSALGKLPHKMISLFSDRPAEPCVLDLDIEKLETRVPRVIAQIEGATFGNPNDKNIVSDLYKEYVGRIATVLQTTLAFAKCDVALVEELPLLPSVDAPPAPPLQLATGQLLLVLPFAGKGSQPHSRSTDSRTNVGAIDASGCVTLTFGGDAVEQILPRRSCAKLGL